MNTADKTLCRWDEPERLDMSSPSIAHFARATAGSSVPDDCVHDLFWRAEGLFVCKWSGFKIQEEI